MLDFTSMTVVFFVCSCVSVRLYIYVCVPVSYQFHICSADLFSFFPPPYKSSSCLKNKTKQKKTLCQLSMLLCFHCITIKIDKDRTISTKRFRYTKYVSILTWAGNCLTMSLSSATWHLPTNMCTCYRNCTRSFKRLRDMPCLKPTKNSTNTTHFAQQ